jgi:hypothetical protein
MPHKLNSHLLPARWIARPRRPELDSTERGLRLRPGSADQLDREERDPR